MIPTTAPKFVGDRRALDDVLADAKQMSCPHCHRTGMLVGHALVTGYAERSAAREVRGRRLLCSARFRRGGCGRTFSVLIATVIARFSVRTSTISALLDAVVGGLCRKAAWERLHTAGTMPGLVLRSCYRIWARLLGAQAHLRTALCRLAAPPATADARPIVETLAHLRQALGRGGCVLAAFQVSLQRGIFD